MGSSSAGPQSSKQREHLPPALPGDAPARDRSRARSKPLFPEERDRSVGRSASDAIEAAQLKPEQPLGLVEVFAGLGCVSQGFAATGWFEPLSSSTSIRMLAKHTFATIQMLASIDLQMSMVSRYVMSGRSSTRGQSAGCLGCPPCQSLSSAGRRDPKDERTKLLDPYFRLVSELRPLFFVMENVPNVLGEPRFEANVARAARSYAVWTGVVNAAYFGLPQTRQRAIAIGYRLDLDVEPSAPIPTHFGVRQVFDYHAKRMRAPALENAATLLGSYPELRRLTPSCAAAPTNPGRLPPLVVVEEAIGDLPAPDSRSWTPSPPSSYARALGVGETEVRNHEPWRHRESTLERLRALPEGHGLFERVGSGRATRYYSQAYSRLHRRGLARTVTTNFHNAGSGRFLHYEQVRTITVREAARLQGIPDQFTFTGLRSVQERLVGNAFPPPLARSLAEHVISEIGDHLVIA